MGRRRADWIVTLSGSGEPSATRRFVERGNRRRALGNWRRYRRRSVPQEACLRLRRDSEVYPVSAWCSLRAQDGSK